MGLLHEIQESVVKEDAELASLLLKLRLLASRLESEVLEEWVKHESEGYPNDVEVPSYRKIGASYTGTFSGPFGSGIRNAPIPSYLIKEYAGENWVQIEVRDSIAAVEDLVRNSDENGGSIGIDASNLILMLQGKVYKDYACNEIRGEISPTSMAEIRQAVRSRILELTVQLEKTVPAAAEVEFGAPDKSFEPNSERVQQISQQVIYGNVTNAVAGGVGSTTNVSVQTGDTQSLIDYLTSAGLDIEDASALAKIVENEEPESVSEPLGEKAKRWLASNLQKAAEGTWNVGVSTATTKITEAVLRFYGLK